MSQRETSRCPVTGMPVMTRPEWTDVRIGPRTTVTFRLIGDSILDIVTVGERTKETQAPLMSVRNRVVELLFPNGRGYVEMYDISRVAGIPPAEVRRQHSLFHLSEHFRDCTGCVVYGMNIFLRSIYRTSLAVAGGGLWYPFRIEKDYEKAIGVAVELLRGVDSRLANGRELSDSDFTSLPEWTLRTADGRGEVKVSVACRRVVLLQLSGILDDPGIADRYGAIMESLYRDKLVSTDDHIRITDYSELDSASQATRIRYVQVLKELHTKGMRTSERSFVVGASIWFRVAIQFGFRAAGMSKGVEFASGRREVFRKVRRMLSHSRALDEIASSGDAEEFLVSRQDLSKLNVMLGALAWDQGDEDLATGFSEDHPLAEVAEAIRLIREDYRAVLERHQEAEQKALAASKAKSEFLANMSHEIRTPLNGVIGMLQIMLQEGLDESQERNASIALASAEGLLAIVSDILDFSKIEAGRMEVDNAVFDLRACLREAGVVMGLQAKGKGLDFVAWVDPGIPPALLGDVVRIRQIMSNLVGNAIKFTSRGEVRVEIRLASRAARSVRLRFSVKDTGIGIPEDKKESVFESFSQADTSTTRKYGGTGLGLSICRRLVELLGGTLQVDSREGVGSEFWFEIELGEVDHAALTGIEYADCGVSRRSQRGGLSYPMPSPSISNPAGRAAGEAKRRILVVEDNQVNLKVARGFLSRMGFESDEAKDGGAAVRMLEAGAYGLVLMDCQMPVMDGFEATRRIRAGDAGERNAKIPIVALTAAARDTDRDAALETGMDAYLSKPFTYSALREMVGKWMPMEPEAS